MIRGTTSESSVLTACSISSSRRVGAFLSFWWWMTPNLKAQAKASLRLSSVSLTSSTMRTWTLIRGVRWSTRFQSWSPKRTVRNWMKESSTLSMQSSKTVAKQSTAAKKSWVAFRSWRTSSKTSESSFSGRPYRTSMLPNAQCYKPSRLGGGVLLTCRRQRFNTRTSW